MYNFFWISSVHYVSEAAASAFRVRQMHSNCNLTLFCDSQIDKPNVFDDVITVDYSDDPWYLRSTYYWSKYVSDYYKDRCAVYMDTDIYVCRPLYDLFGTTRRYDFCAAHAPGRKTAKTVSHVPTTFPEFNIGVLGVSFGKRMRSFINRWYDVYARGISVYGNNDQAPLREALWNYGGSLKILTLPIEYNFRFGFGGQIRFPVYVLHGRSGDLERINRIVNEHEWSIRSWRQGELV